MTTEKDILFASIDAVAEQAEKAEARCDALRGEMVTLGICFDKVVKEREAMREALELVLLFHRADWWKPECQEKWKSVTGEEMVTTKVLCNHIRKVLG